MLQDPPDTLLSPDVAESRDARARLLSGIGDAVALKGYAATTIADIVAAARVSKRTFYEHFSSKEACFTALYVERSTRALRALKDALDADLHWQKQVETAIARYFDTLIESPLRARSLYIEVLRMGAAGLQLRRAAHHRFARWMVDVVAREHPLSESDAAMAFSLACAVVGGIHEMVLDTLERDALAELPTKIAPASRLVRSVFASGW